MDPGWWNNDHSQTFQTVLVDSTNVMGFSIAELGALAESSVTVEDDLEPMDVDD